MGSNNDVGISNKDLEALGLEIRNSVKEKVKKARDMVYKEYMKATYDFYDDYDVKEYVDKKTGKITKSYERQYNFRDRSGKPYKIDHGRGRNMEGGVLVTTEDMEKCYKDETGYVLRGAFGLVNDSSLHGIYTGKTGFNVYKYMSEAVDKIAKEIAEEIAHGEVEINE